MSVLRYSNLFVNCIGLLYIAAIYSTGVGLAQAVVSWTCIEGMKVWNMLPANVQKATTKVKFKCLIKKICKMP